MSEDHGSVAVTLGPRPGYLVDRIPPGPLRTKLQGCSSGPFERSRFSIGHRGAPLQFPEHTLESYRAAARMGAGAIECDATFTSDRQLVCRHSQCDLATTTNILETPLARRCRVPFAPARVDASTGEILEPARAQCCTSDLTLAEFRSLEGRMESNDPGARSVQEYLGNVPAWRTRLYANRARLMSHRESIELFDRLGVDMVPELKEPLVPMPFDGDYDARAYARALVDDYRRAGIDPRRVRLQSFSLDDIRFWLQEAPEFGERAVWLDGRSPLAQAPTPSEFEALYEEGIRTIAPPIPTLLRVGRDGELLASPYAVRARRAGLELVTWTAERSGRIGPSTAEGKPRDFYYGSVLASLEDDGDLYRVIDALVHEVGIVGLFSDWPATTTYYANCFGLE